MLQPFLTERVDADGLDTPYTLNASQSFLGTLTSRTDISDFVALNVTQGRTYTVEAVADSSTRAPTLVLLDSDDRFVAFGESVLRNPATVLKFVADTTGEVFVDIGMANQLGGSYTVSFAETPEFAPRGLSQIADYLTAGYAAYKDEEPAKWNLPSSGPNRSLTYDARALGPNGEVAAAMAFRAWSDIMGVEFIPTTVRPDIRFTQESESAFAQEESFGGLIFGATINMYQSNYAKNGRFLPNDYEVLLHEIGHALGLGHAGPYNFVGNYAFDAEHTGDTVRNSVMSYFRVFEEAYNPLIDATVMTPMAADILAIEALYGRAAQNEGDTVYGLNAGNTDPDLLPDGLLGSYTAAAQNLLGEGEVTRQFTALTTIIDDGGIDTLDHTNTRLSLEIDLSIAGPETTTVADRFTLLMPGTVIENAIGGVFGDVIRGNRVDNVLTGNDGDDLLIGTSGADRLLGGDGSDTLFGDAATDLVDLDAYNQVFRLYQAVLGRGPDADGYEFWTEQLVTQQRSLANIASSFVESREFTKLTGDLDSDGFVTLLYRNVLGRAADEAGFDSWTDALDAGQTRAAVVLGFSESQEFINSTSVAASAVLKAQTAQYWTDDVFRLYQATLDRAPDMGGFLNWSTALAQGSDLADVATGFTQSREFQATYGDTTDVQFVQLLYTNVLDREASSSEIDGWLSELDSAQSREDVLLGFSQSREFQAAQREALDGWVDAQGTDDVLIGSTGDDRLVGGVLSDLFVFEAHDEAMAQRVTVFDLEGWDQLAFNGFGYDTADAITDNLRQSGGDVIFTDQGLTAVFKDTVLDIFAEDMFAL